MSETGVRYERRGALGLITLDRRDQLNALTRGMIDGLNRLVLEADADPDVLAIALTGAGRGFCAGLDAGYLREVAERGVAPPDPNELPVLFPAMLKAHKPLIAAVNGPAAGGGFALAVLCDLRFMAEGAQLTTVFAKRGLVAEQGMSWFLPRIVGVSRALDLLWSCRKVGAEEAFHIGLADRVVPADELLPAVEAYVAALYAEVAPRAVVLSKQQVYGDLDRDLAEALHATDRLIRDTVDDPDTREGVASLIERRPPRFARWPRG